MDLSILAGDNLRHDHITVTVKNAIFETKYAFQGRFKFYKVHVPRTAQYPLCLTRSWNDIFVFVKTNVFGIDGGRFFLY